MRKYRRFTDVTQDLRRGLEMHPSDDQFDPKLDHVRYKLHRITAQPQEKQRHLMWLLWHARSVRLSLVSAASLASVMGVSVYGFGLFGSDKKTDILALAAQKYEKREGILALQGSSVSHEKRWIHNQRKWLDDTYHREFQSWLTTDGLYQRDITSLGGSPGLHLERVTTPEGSCMSNLHQRPYVSVFTPSPKKNSDQVESKSCPFGLGLSLRIHTTSLEGYDYIGGLPKDVFQTVIDPSDFLRKIRSGEFKRYEAKEAIQDGVEVYVIRAWGPVKWIEENGRTRLLDDLEQRTLVLDRKTLDIRSYEQRANYNGDGEHEEITAETITFSQPPKLVPENKENEHLLQMTYVPSRVDADPFDAHDRKLSEQYWQEEKRKPAE